MEIYQEPNPHDWYSSLTKSEKSSFIRYFCNKYNMSASTLMHKLNNRRSYRLTFLEKKTIIHEINEGLWR